MSSSVVSAAKIMDQKNSPVEQTTLGTLFWTFLKIGSTAFGGFMALISVVQNYAVERKKLLKHEDMLNGISLATILPGPVAVNVVAYVGYRVRGWRGALVSAFAVILPSFLMLILLSYVYFLYGQIPAVGKFFMGFIPAVSAIIIAVAWNLGVKTIKGTAEAIIALVAVVLLLTIGGFFITILIIAVSGLAGWVLFRDANPSTGTGTGEEKKEGSLGTGKKPADSSASHLIAASVPMLTFNLGVITKLFFVFAGMSVLLFGGGYVFIPLMQHSVVETYGWVSRQEFIDAIALGQVTPGPIAIAAAFIGFKVAGLFGAAAATAGIFGPAAFVMLLCTRFLDRIKNSKGLTAALRGIRSSVIGMIAAAAVVVVRTSEPALLSVLIFAAALTALLKFKVETAWIIPAAGIAGMLFY